MSRNAFIQEEIETSEFDAPVRSFLSLLLIVNDDQARRYHFLHRFVSFLNGQDGYLPFVRDFAQGEVDAARELAGLERISLRVARAVELLWAGCSLKRIEDLPELWCWDEEEGHYFHLKNRNYTRKELGSCHIYGITKLHHFPNPNYHHWQAYGVPESLFEQDYFLDPFKSPVKYYYSRAWDGRENLLDHLKTNPRELPAGQSLSEWLSLQRDKRGIEDRDYNRMLSERVA